MKIDVRTPDGKQMTAKAATLPLGTALRIAPAFTATATADDISVETTITVAYAAEAGRYLITGVTNRAVGTTPEISTTVLRQVRLGELLSAAVPYCLAVRYEDAGKWTTVRELFDAAGRILPDWMARGVRNTGPTSDTLEIVQLLYAIAALATTAPMQTVATELGIPGRTATHWINKARNAGLLDGITYAVGRQPNGRTSSN